MTEEEKKAWRSMAYSVIERVARENKEFTPDAIWLAGLPKPDDARMLGGVMRRAKKDGLIAKTGRVQPTSQPESHGTDVTVWRSLIYGR